ncbi:outer membrane beta-barrel protein [Vibrio parahaemolyticus]|nr:outer membrane beta-barrel protein [Vibrio parahaemolyticus]EJO2025998.1 outer membrane beta-barrel protein [Vibrio parahaemolyticus]
MKLIKGSALALIIVSAQASAAYSVGFRAGMINQEFSVSSQSNNQSGFSYGLEVSELNYFWKNISLGWSIAADMAKVNHDSLKDLETLDVLAGPVFSYRIAAIAPEFCGCRIRRVHDGISLFIKPQVNYWRADWDIGGGADSESDVGLAWSIGFKYQDSRNFALGVEYQEVYREITLNRSAGSSIDIDDERVVISLGYRF